MRRAVLIALCGFFVGAIVGTQSAAVAGNSNVERVPIAQPPTWVPFSAKLDVVTPSRVPLTGRFIRGVTGAHRVELVDGKGWSSIEITDEVKRVYYRNVAADGRQKWLAGRLESAIDASRPLQFTTGVQGMSPYPRKLAILEGQDGSLTSHEGLEAWLYTTNTGSMRLLAPALNFAVVVDASIYGRRWELSRVQIGPVDETEFEPPSNAEIDWSGPINKGFSTHQPAAAAKQQ